jgi:hypothetical protein
LRDQTDTIRSLDAKVKAITDESLRARCRTCQRAVLNCLEGISLAEKQLIRTFCKNGAGLHQMIQREIESERDEAQRNGHFNLPGYRLLNIKHDQYSQLMVTAARSVLGDESFFVAEGKKNPTGDSVVAGAVRIAVETATTLQKAQNDTARERERALLPPSLSGSTRGVRELLEITEARGHIKGLGWQGGTAFLMAQVSSALATDPPDDAMLLKLESAGLPFLRELLNMGMRKLDAEITSAKNVPKIRDGLVGQIIGDAMKLVTTFEGLRESRVPPDLAATAAIIAVCTDLFRRIASLGDIAAMDDQTFKDLVGVAGVEGKLAKLEATIDPAWLLRGLLGPEKSKALRSFPAMRGLATVVEWPAAKAATPYKYRSIER